ncbi:aspartate carbamoyltransferase catalytic subunit [Furfurilactobacillus rossiae]|nr:aspartate carbamoyltransferase catalytic subunit [Furfurilactobacillus rossiae]QFR67217.1 aspartate carbamoyltransferase catalytic subunit [Furfurilactobacillus rossiae]QLE60141.1 Aspartate carbamoyltransferase [Furfurilactobacillus rossiae]
MNQFTNLNRLTNEEVMQLIEQAIAFKQGTAEIPEQKRTVANLFFENSTRTKSSFQMAELKLGWSQIVVDPSSSSTAKGESLSDTLKTLGAIGVDAVVVRHRQTNWYEPLLHDESGLMPILINAGDGSGQHPSQSLLDLMTIYEEFGHFEELHIRIVGDLSHSRVARSNAEILQRLGVSVSFAGPASWYPEDFNQFGQRVELDDDLSAIDVMMMLRVQHERLSEAADEQFDAASYHEAYGLTVARYERLAPQAIIMHPAPVNRGVEIADSLVESPKSRIFKQMANGVFARMAILTSVTEAKHAVTN